MDPDMTILLKKYRDLVETARKMRMPLKELLTCLELIRQIRSKELGRAEAEKPDAG